MMLYMEEFHGEYAAIDEMTAEVVFTGNYETVDNFVRKCNEAELDEYEDEAEDWGEEDCE